MKGKGNLQILDVKPATDADPGDSGSYMCRAENDIDSNDAEAELNVLGKNPLYTNWFIIQVWYNKYYKLGVVHYTYLEVPGHNFQKILILLFEDLFYLYKQYRLFWNSVLCIYSICKNTCYGVSPIQRLNKA